MRIAVATKVTILSCFTLIQPFQRLEGIEAEVERKAAMRSIFLMCSCELQARQKTIKIAKSQSRLRAIGTERLNSRLWRTEIFLLRKESHQSTAARVFLT